MTTYTTDILDGYCVISSSIVTSFEAEELDEADLGGFGGDTAHHLFNAVSASFMVHHHFPRLFIFLPHDVPPITSSYQLHITSSDNNTGPLDDVVEHRLRNSATENMTSFLQETVLMRS